MLKIYTPSHISLSHFCSKSTNLHLQLFLLGSYDSSVFVWDIGGRRGTVYELNGHRNKVNTVHYVPSAKSLLSTGEDSNLVIWNMSVYRNEVKHFNILEPHFSLVHLNYILIKYIIK